MAIEIYHQLGFRQNWNFDSYNDDRVGDGFILAPSHMERNDVLGLSNEIKNISIFDPQFFLPNTQIRALSSYDFFPDRVANGFQTNEFGEELCEECAERCVRFQIDSNFNKIIIPTRYLTGMPPSFIEQQNRLFVTPFLNALESASNSKPVLLQLVLNDNMVKNEDYASDLLNWITSIQGISGVYLITDINPRQKQLKDIEFLLAYLKFIDALRNNDLYVLLGFQNIESILLSIADPNAIAIGSYENLRMFNIRNFEIREPGVVRGPNPRIYVSQLLQWIEYNYVLPIRRVMGEHFFDENHYHATVFQPTYRWHFLKPELYKHFFLVFSEQMKLIGNVDGRNRYEFVSELLAHAWRNFSRLQEAGIVLDQSNDGSHIPTWITAANLYANHKGWRAA